MGCCCKKRQEINVDLLLGEDPQIIDSRNTSQEAQLNEVKLKMSLDKFQIIKLLGTGTFGKVLLVKLKTKKAYYAMKVLNKKMLKLKEQEIHTKNERDIMVEINSPFIINIKFAFQDDINLYLVSEFMQGGELFFHLKNKKCFDEELVKLYTMELVLAIIHIHEKDAVYRDLKPENILLDKDGHIKLTDFGLCKIIKDDDKAYTICGTITYLAPEILLNKGYQKEVDWWSLGCVVFRMLEGRSPFGIPRGQLTLSYFKQEITFKNNESEEAKDFVKSLLVFEPEERLGYGDNGSDDIKNHAFFRGMDWTKAYNKEYQPSFVPKLDNVLDLKYFDRTFTDEKISVEDLKSDENNETLNYTNFSFEDKDAMKKENDDVLFSNI
jgi:serine/threonine protein kinase